MAGVMSLMQPQGQQGPMPGQASQQPMPGMMPQQGAPTPGAMVDQLATMPFEKLEQFYSNPRPQSPPLYAVIAAIVKQQKAAQLGKQAEGQQAMAQNAQMQQQPPIAEGIMQQARQQHMPQMPQQPVMAAYGGEMHGYAGGGSVAFRHGGGVQHFRYGADEFGVMSNPEADAMDALRVERAQQERQSRSEQEQKEKQLKTLEETYYALRMQNDPRAEQVKQQLDILSGRVSQPTATPQQIPPTSAFARPPYVAPESAPGPAAGPRRQPAAVTKPVTPMDQGLGALQEQPPTPAIDPYAAASAAQQAAMRRAGEVTPEMTAARGGIDKLLGESAASFAGETTRRKDLAQQRMQEALGRFERPGYKSMGGIGRLLEGMKGATTIYGGLVGAGAAAGRYQEDKEAALRAAQEKFDLSGKEVFDLSRLQEQVKMKQAELVEARASGDAQRAVKAAMDVANSQKELAQYQTELGMKREKMALDTRDVESRRISAEAARTQAGKPSEIQQREALYRRDPGAYEAMFGPKESAAVANLVRAVNSDPALKSLAEGLKLGTPEAEARYEARYKALVAMHAPQLLLGAGGGGGGGALEAATAIARGGK